MGSRISIAERMLTSQERWHNDSQRNKKNEGNKCALILAWDDTASEVLPLLVRDCGLEPVRLNSIGELRTGALDSRTAVLLCEETLPDGSFRDALQILNGAVRRIPVVVFSRIADWDSYLRAMRHGAYDCLRYPFGREELGRIVRQILRAPDANA